MDSESLLILAHLLQNQRIGSLGTLRRGSPFVSLTPFAPSEDYAAYYIHISRLAHHTQDILGDGRVSLMIAIPDHPQADPTNIPRLTIVGKALELAREDPQYPVAKKVYLERFPQAARNFNLADFHLFRILPTSARLVAGFGKIYSLKASDIHP